MQQICPSCKRLVSEEYTVCPYCNGDLHYSDDDLTSKVRQRPMTRKEAVAYAAGYLLLLFAGLHGRSFSNPGEMLEGLVIFVAATSVTIFCVYIRNRGGVGFPNF